MTTIAAAGDKAQYRVRLPVMVLAFRDNHEAAVTIPTGAILEVVGQAEDDDRFVVVRFQGQEFLVFESDLTQRVGRI